jgi:hypothetical protein
VRLELDAWDPDREALQVQVTWMRNGTVFRSGPATVLPAADLYPGDNIYARVRVSDGRAEDVIETELVTIRNLAPYVTSVRIRPDTITAAESILAAVESVDPEEDDVEYRFRWLRNGDEMLHKTDQALEAGLVRRGDELQVGVVPIDDNGNEGDEVLSALAHVQNAPPVITSGPPFTLAGPRLYEYRVAAEDPDGDGPLRFELAEGPRGARIDIVTGRLLWTIPLEAAGSHDLEISVQDPHGGESRQRYTLQVRLEAPPAAPR